MHVFICKIKEFLRKNTKKYSLLIGGIIILCLFIGFMLGNRENVSSNGNTIDAIRNELDQAEKSKQDIEGTASDIKRNKYKNLKAQSEQLQMQVNDLTSSLTNANQLLTKIRKQPAGE